MALSVYYQLVDNCYRMAEAEGSPRYGPTNTANWYALCTHIGEMTYLGGLH